MTNQPWVDLSEYGLQLKLVRSFSGVSNLVLLGESNIVRDLHTPANKLGFKPHSTNKKLLFKVAKFDDNGALTEKISVDAFRPFFPKAKADTYELERHYVDLAASHAADKPVDRPQDAAAAKGVPARVLSGGHPLGFNRFVQEVYELNGERYIKDTRGMAVSERDGTTPGLFLRAPDAESLAICAEAFVEQAARGRVQHAADLQRFISTIGHQGPSTEFTDAVTAALGRHLAKRGGTTLGDAFIAASKMHEALPCLHDTNGVFVAGPMAVAAQRILGLDPALSDRTIAIDDAGPGYLLSHMPKGARFEIRADSEKHAAALRGVAAVRGLKDVEFRRGGLQSSDARGLFADVGSNHSAIIPQLGKIATDGVGVIVLDAPKNDQEEARLAAIRDQIAREWRFEAESTIDGGLWGGHPDLSGRIMLAIAGRRSEPSEDALPPSPRPIHDWTSLWTWTAEIVSNRAREADRSRLAAAADVELKGDADPKSINSFQVPYASASRVGNPSTMVPRNLEAATREALARVVRQHGDVDSFVAAEFGYSKEDLARIFSAEQIDALALYLHADERERGFLIADQTGVGKGRTLAAILRRAAMRGERVMFLTERQQNLSDIWRDIVHTESAAHFLPMVLNDSVSIIDEATKKVVMRGAAREDVDAMLDSGAWPAGVNLLLGTYSQFNREVHDGQSTTDGDLTKRKSAWLRKAIDAETKLVLDECHNAAASTSNVGKNIKAAVDACGGVVFSSATFAKTAEHMDLYWKLLPEGLLDGEMALMMQRGGETFQEILSAMLVQDGVMIRREFDLSRVTYRTVVDTQRFDRNRAYMDAVAPILAEFVKFAASCDQTVQDERNARANEAEAAGGPVPQAFRSGYGSPLYTISRLFVAALKIDIVVEQAIDALQNNRKPVIVVENTVQSLLEELAEQDIEVDGAVVADFRALFHRILRKMGQRTLNTQNGAVRDLTADYPELKAISDRIRRLIENLPDIPASAVDEVKRRINETGFTCDEITGRTLEIRGGRVMRRPASNPTVIKNSFNSGDLDAVIINSAGATGIDLHAGSRFQDQRPRVLLELQAPADILRKIQGHGRVNRYDQVEDPEIIAFLSGLPIEMRLAAMENAKLRRLSANTTSNRDAAILVRDIPDLINPVGDIVCSRYAEARPELMRRLGFKVDDIQLGAKANLKIEMESSDKLRTRLKQRTQLKVEKAARGEEIEVSDNKRTANEILARLIMLPVSLQERVCNELTAEFHAAIEELEARGQTPLKTHELPGIVHVKETKSFDGVESEEVDSLFHEPLYAVTGALERVGTPIKTDGLLERIQIGEMASGRAFACIERLQNDLEEILRPYLPANMTVAEALARGHKEVTRRKEAIDRLITGLEKIKPGVQVTYSVDEIAVSGVVTRIEYPPRGYEHVASTYGVEFVVPGDQRPRSMRLGTLLNDSRFAVKPGLESNDYEKLLKAFEDAEALNLHPVTILTNNLYRGMRYNTEYNLGRLVTYKDSSGSFHRGILVTNKNHRDLNFPVGMTDSKMAQDAVADGIELVGSPSLSDKLIALTPEGSGVRLRLPPRNSRKYGFVYDVPTINDFARRDPSLEKNGSANLLIQADEVAEVVDALYRAGASLFANGTCRKWAQERMQRMSKSKKAAPAPAMIR